MKNILLFLLLSLTPSFQLLAQNKIDSVGSKIKTAKADARNFKPTKEIRLARRKRLLLNTSDYFSPTAKTVSNPKMLVDSDYVRAYKDAAYVKSIHRGDFVHLHYVADLSAGHIIVVTVAVAAVVVGTIYFVKILSGIYTK